MQCVPDRAGAPHSQLSAVGSWLPLGPGSSSTLAQAELVTLGVRHHDRPRPAVGVFIHDSRAEPLGLGRLAILLDAHVQMDAVFAGLPSGTRWKKSRGSTPAGSEQAATSRNADEPPGGYVVPCCCRRRGRWRARGVDQGRPRRYRGQVPRAQVAATDGATSSGRHRTERFSAIMIPCPVGREIYR
jgi:hypothetical protein